MGILKFLGSLETESELYIKYQNGEYNISVSPQLKKYQCRENVYGSEFLKRITQIG